MAATTVYLSTTVTPPTITRGTNTTNKAGSGVWWTCSNTNTTQYTAASAPTATSVNGATSGIELVSGTGIYFEWITPPLAAAVTISGTVTFNFWASESSMSANATICCMVQRVAATTFELSDIVTGSSFGTELGTGLAAKQWTSATTSRTRQSPTEIAKWCSGSDEGIYRQ